MPHLWWMNSSLKPYPKLIHHQKNKNPIPLSKKHRAKNNHITCQPIVSLLKFLLRQKYIVGSSAPKRAQNILCHFPWFWGKEQEGWILNFKYFWNREKTGTNKNLFTYPLSHSIVIDLVLPLGLKYLDTTSDVQLCAQNRSNPIQATYIGVLTSHFLGFYQFLCISVWANMLSSLHVYSPL